MYKYVYAIHNYSEQLQKHDFPGHWDIKPQDRLLGRRRTSDHNAAVSGNTKLSILSSQVTMLRIPATKSAQTLLDS